MIQARYFVIASAAMVFGMSAFAGGGVPANTTPVTWDEFRARCENPNSFPNQHKPEQIHVECKSIEHEWVPDAPGSVPLNDSHRVVSALFSDKFTVSPIERDYPMAAKAGGCTRYKEIEKVFTIMRELSCGDVIGIKGDITDYCAGALAGSKGVNPKFVDTHDTGRVIPCGDSQPDNGKGKGD